ncbi:hypothetical protein JW916_08990 [Candidatus Sumerlaeota bacterium]|nr:hypothetical protein [Candidatus Sumerlaeota bacterium]
MFEDRGKTLQTRRTLVVRVGLLVASAALGLAFIAARISYLTAWRGQDLYDLSERNFLKFAKIPAPRGQIVDRYGRVLADSETRFDVHVTPFRLSREDVAKTLDEVRRLCPAARVPDVAEVVALRPRFRRLPVASQLGLEEVSPLFERQAALPGIEIEETFKRIYPYGRLAAHLTGHVGAIGEGGKDFFLEQGYDLDDIVGRAGLEAKHELSFLRGSQGEQLVMRDARMRVVPLRVHRKAVQGATLTLTIDVDLQRAAMNLLAGRMGSVVAVDPRNGDVLALFSYPTYDPNNPVCGPGDSERLDALREHYAPGSTFKIVTASAWLAMGGSPNRTETCAGSLQVAPGFAPKCNVEWGHGTQDLRGALARSCNVYFYKIAMDVGATRMTEMAARYGFGSVSGIGLMDRGESPGVLGSRHGTPANLGNTVMMGIGQGGLISATPLQVAMAYAALANGGTLFAPRIVREIQRPDGGTIQYFPTPRGEIGLSEAQRNVLIDGFRAAVEQSYGTAHKAQFDPAMRAAGKTGTAQRAGKSDAWFVCFAPWDRPEICVAILVEEAGHGGETAAPLAKAFLDEYYRLKKTHLPPQVARRIVADRPNGGVDAPFFSQRLDPRGGDRR